MTKIVLIPISFNKFYKIDYDTIVESSNIHNCIPSSVAGRDEPAELSAVALLAPFCSVS